MRLSSPPRRLARDLARAPLIRAGAVTLAVGGLLVLLCWTLFIDAQRLVADFPTDSWLMAQQADSLRLGAFPSYFAHADPGVFYPAFAFYGGTLFAFGGAIALVVGSSMVAEVIVDVLALAVAYGGWLWLARMAGLRSWRSHVPAVLYVTAPYVMTNIYIRQDLTESAATASIPLLLASGLSVLRADRLRAGPVAALAVSTITLGGSHNLTLLWGTTILGLTAIALAAAVPQVRDMVTRRGLLRVLAIVVPAMAVNAWYLLPDLAYHSHTVIAHRVSEWRDLLGKPGPLVEAKYLFSPGRSSPFPGSGLTVALPVLTIAWLAIAAVAARARWREPWARTLAVLALASAVVLVVMVHPGLITGLPDPWLMLQFSYRLESFVLFGISGATIAALVLLDHTNNRWSAALLIPIAAFSTFGAARQMHGAPRAKADFAWTIDNFSAFSMGDFADPTLTQRPPVGNTRLVRFLRSDVKHDHIDATIAAQPGDVVYTDLMSLPQMVDVQGARVIGGWALPPLQRNWQGRWSLVLQIDEDATPGKAHLVVREARTLPIVGGRIISILGLLGLTTVAGVIARAGVLRRRRGER